MTDLEIIRELIDKIPSCVILTDENTYMEVQGTYGRECLVFGFDENGDIIAMGY